MRFSFVRRQSLLYCRCKPSPAKRYRDAKIDVLRVAFRKTALYCNRWKDQSSDWFCWCVCRSDGSSCIPDGRFQREPNKLPVNACYGTKRSRCYRLCSCSWFLHADFWLGSSIRKMTFRTAQILRVGLGGYLYKR